MVRQRICTRLLKTTRAATLSAMLAVALVVSQPGSVKAGTVERVVSASVGWFNDTTSGISDRFLFDPVASTQARLSASLLAHARDLDNYLESEGLVMPEPGQQTGPAATVAHWLSDAGCAMSDAGFGTLRTLRDESKDLFARVVTRASVGVDLFHETWLGGPVDADR